MMMMAVFVTLYCDSMHSVVQKCPCLVNIVLCVVLYWPRVALALYFTTHQEVMFTLA